MNRKKICVIGAAAVGKTTLIASYAGETRTPEYRSTLGVRITTAAVTAGQRLRELVIWDIKGETTFYRIPPVYFAGAQGCLLVADGTRSDTVQAALRLRDELRSSVGDVPHVLLINKLDLRDRWEVDEERLSLLRRQAPEVYTCSARGGIAVQTAMEALARRMWGAP